MTWHLIAIIAAVVSVLGAVASWRYFHRVRQAIGAGLRDRTGGGGG